MTTRLAALEAVAEAARKIDDLFDDDTVSCRPWFVAHRDLRTAVSALDAAPKAEEPARNVDGWMAYRSASKVVEAVREDHKYHDSNCARRACMALADYDAASKAQQPCDTCEGHQPCNECGAVGWTAEPDRNGEPQQVQCEECHGTGVAVDQAEPDYETRLQRAREHAIAFASKLEPVLCEHDCTRGSTRGNNWTLAARCVPVSEGEREKAKAQEPGRQLYCGRPARECIDIAIEHDTLRRERDELRRQLDEAQSALASSRRIVEAQMHSLAQAEKERDEARAEADMLRTAANQAGDRAVALEAKLSRAREALVGMSNVVHELWQCEPAVVRAVTEHAAKLLQAALADTTDESEPVPVQQEATSETQSQCESCSVPHDVLDAREEIKRLRGEVADAVAQMTADREELAWTQQRERALRAQRDELVGALRGMLTTHGHASDNRPAQEAWDRAEEVLVKCREVKP